MLFHFLAPAGSEPWDHSRPAGISGSETAIREISKRLARRGHDVRVYSPCFPDTTDEPGTGVRWGSISSGIDPREPGAWWFCRHPGLLDEFPSPRQDQRLFLRCDDIHYGTDAMTPNRVAKLSGVLAMTELHADVLKEYYPYLPESMIVSGGYGIESDHIRDFLAGKLIKRDPYRLTWNSSPDRGLEHLIRIFHRARAKIPQLNLHVYYGWQGCDFVAGGDPNHEKVRLKRLCTEELPQDGITWHGRVDRREEIWESLARSGLWVYPNTWPETACVAACEAQAFGAVVVTRPHFGLKETVRNGILIPGDPADPVVAKRYEDTIVRICTAGSPFTRATIPTDVLKAFDWERVVDLHEELAGCGRPYVAHHGERIGNYAA